MNTINALRRMKSLPEVIYHANISKSPGSNQTIITGTGAHKGETVIFIIPTHKIDVPFTSLDDGSVKF